MNKRENGCWWTNSSLSYKKGKGDRMGAGAVVREQDRNENGDKERIISRRRTSSSRAKALGLDSEQSLRHRSTALVVILGFGAGVSVASVGEEALFY